MPCCCTCHALTSMCQVSAFALGLKGKIETRPRSMSLNTLEQEHSSGTPHRASLGSHASRELGLRAKPSAPASPQSAENPACDEGGRAKSSPLSKSHSLDDSRKEMVQAQARGSAVDPPPHTGRSAGGDEDKQENEEGKRKEEDGDEEELAHEELAHEEQGHESEDQHLSDDDIEVRPRTSAHVDTTLHKNFRRRRHFKDASSEPAEKQDTPNTPIPSTTSTPNISNTPSTPSVPSKDYDVIRSGALWKRPVRRPNALNVTSKQRLRWFELTREHLSYYDYSADTRVVGKIKGRIPVARIVDVTYATNASGTNDDLLEITMDDGVLTCRAASKVKHGSSLSSSHLHPPLFMIVFFFILYCKAHVGFYVGGSQRLGESHHGSVPRPQHTC